MILTKKKIYVIDTNVIIDDPYCIDKIEGDIYIPTTVIKELDKHKYDGGQKGYHIREFARLISKNESINIHNSEFYSGTNDEKIIETAQVKQKQFGKVGKDDLEVVILTNDILMSLLAKAMGVSTQEHDCKIIVNPHIYTGIRDLSKSTNLLKDELQNCHPNEYLVGAGGIQKYVGGKVKRVGKDRKIWGITHRNVEQRCVIDALMDDDIKLVTISGIAGTGKTLMAIAAGLEKTIGENKYRKLLVSRPVVPMGNDLGYLPGDINEKLSPWMQPIFDNIDYLFDTKDNRKQNDQWKELEKQGLLKLEALTYIRGRSIPDQFIVIDEAQNLTKHEVKTILSRAGENTKVVLTGDPDQIDNTKLSSKNNGLTYVIERFKNRTIAAHVTLTKGERSELANIAAEIL